jgi:apolipoprotein N-acyltransferase
MTVRTVIVSNVISGALWLLAFPPAGWYGLGFVFLAPHFVFLLQETRLWRLLWGVLLFRGMLLAGLVPGFFEPLFYLTSLLLFAGIVPALLLLKRLLRVLPRQVGLPPIVAALATAACYFIFERLQAHASLLPLVAMTSGCSLGNSPFVGLARFGGEAGLSVFVVLVNAILAAAWLDATQRHSRRIAPEGRRTSAAWIVIAALVASGWLLSVRCLARNRAAYERRPNRLRVAAVSVSAEFAKETRAKHVEDYETSAAAVEAIAGYVHTLEHDLRRVGRPDLVIFPEDMIDLEFWGMRDDEAFQRLTITNAGPVIRLYRTVAQHLQSPLLFVLTTREQGGRFNSALLLDDDGRLNGMYHKRHLAFAMESWPLGDFHPFYFDWVMDEDARYESPVYNPEYRYRAGYASVIFRLPEGFAFGTPICIEAHHPNLLQDMVRRGARALIHTSSNMSLSRGLRTYMEGTMNLRRIEAVWLETPIVFCGRRDDAGMVLPDGTVDRVPLSEASMFSVYRGSIRY